MVLWLNGQELLHNGDMYFNCSFNLLWWWMSLLFKFNNSTYVRYVYIHSHCLPILSHPFILFQVINDECSHERDGISSTCCTLVSYHHIIIVELWNNKDSRCFLLYLEIIILCISFPCIVCLLYHVYLIIYCWYILTCHLF